MGKITKNDLLDGLAKKQNPEHVDFTFVSRVCDAWSRLAQLAKIAASTRARRLKANVKN